MMEEEPTNERMETYPIQIYESPTRDRSDNKENVVLQSLVSDPDRHIPSAEHRSPTINAMHDKQAAAMYTLGTRYQSIPPKHLPKKTDPHVYYIGSRQTQESPVIRQEREPSFLNSPDKPSNAPVVFLEPQVVSQPILYSIAGERFTPAIDQPISITQQSTSPTIYSISGRPRTVDLRIHNSEISTPNIDQYPALYSWVGSPRLQNDAPEPTKHFLQSSPNLYSIVGSPARTSRAVQVDTPSPIQPTPILYTIVGDTPPTTNKPKENYPSPRMEAAVFTLNNDAMTHKSLPQQQQQAMPKPTIYALVDRQTSPILQENRSKPPARKKTPSPPQSVTVTIRRMSRSLDRRPEIISEEIISHPTTKRQSQPKESTIPKPELIVIPVHDDDHRSRPPVSRQPLVSYTHPEPPHRKPNHVTRHPTLQLSDHQVPYTNRTHKPYREQKYNTDTLPVISNHRPERKERPPLYEPRYRVERHHTYVPLKPVTLERHPVNTKPRSSLWDNGYQTQTDDDEDYDQKQNKKTRSYSTTRPRAPWIPVW